MHYKIQHTLLRTDRFELNFKTLLRDLEARGAASKDSDLIDLRVAGREASRMLANLIELRSCTVFQGVSAPIVVILECDPSVALQSLIPELRKFGICAVFVMPWGSSEDDLVIAVRHEVSIRIDA